MLMQILPTLTSYNLVKLLSILRYLPFERKISLGEYPFIKSINFFSLFVFVNLAITFFGKSN